jgi:serine/threonine-protein phosphatase 2A activator
MTLKDLLPLREVSLSELANLQVLPVPRIREDHDVEKWRNTVGYRDFNLFLRRLNESVVGYDLPTDVSSLSPISQVNMFSSSIIPNLLDPLAAQSVRDMIAFLDTLDKWIDEIPPLPTPQRFGNLAFRTWGRRLEEVRTSRISC